MSAGHKWKPLEPARMVAPMIDDLESIPPFLDRVGNLTNDQLAALSAKARKNAGKPRARKFEQPPDSRAPLTEVDLANIRALKRLGADKVSAVRQIGARPKPSPKPKTTRAVVAAVADPKPATEKQETVMAKKTKTKKASQAKARTPVKGKTESGVRPGSKLEIIVGMLKRPEGCTTKQVLEACKWPAVSMPQQAEAAGLTLKKEKVDGVTVYRAA